MMGWNSAVEVIACIFRTGINGGGPIAPGRLIPPPYPNCRAVIRNSIIIWIREEIGIFFKCTCPLYGH